MFTFLYYVTIISHIKRICFRYRFPTTSPEVTEEQLEKERELHQRDILNLLKLKNIQYIYIPTNVNKNHWIGWIIDLKNYRITLFDSLGTAEQQQNEVRSKAVSVQEQKLKGFWTAYLNSFGSQNQTKKILPLVGELMNWFKKEYKKMEFTVVYGSCMLPMH